MNSYADFILKTSERSETFFKRSRQMRRIISAFRCYCLCIFSILYFLYWTDSVECHFRVGTGVADVTGLCGNIQMMGYAELSQQATGIHMRLKSRGTDTYLILI